MDLMNYKISVKVADSDRFFYVVTVTCPTGEVIEGKFSPGCSFEANTEVPQDLSDDITDCLLSANLEGCEHA